MGTIHQLILDCGVDQARQSANGKLDRQCVETAFAVLADEDRRIGITHAGFAMTALPHKPVTELVWVRHGVGITLRIDSGHDRDGSPIGLPYGSVARMILLYLQTEAVRNRSREVELGKSMNRWLATMGLGDGGKQFALVREQARRISRAKLTFYGSTEVAAAVRNRAFVRDDILPTTDNDQLSLWHQTVILDEAFYDDLIKHPLPVREAAIRQIGSRSMALDAYIWLAYRLHALEASTPITWAGLYEQFGAGFGLVRQFKAKFKEPLQLALAAYPEARVDITDAGVTLHPSPPPVPEKRISGKAAPALKLIAAPATADVEQRALSWLRNQPFLTRKLWAEKAAAKGAELGKASTAPGNIGKWIGMVAEEIVAAIG